MRKLVQQNFLFDNNESEKFENLWLKSDCGEKKTSESRDQLA